jgi:hypothetical protein
MKLAHGNAARADPLAAPSVYRAPESQASFSLKEAMVRDQARPAIASLICAFLILSDCNEP